MSNDTLPRVISGPAYEPVTLEQVKLQLRVTWTSEDDLLETYSVAARRYVERELSRAIIQQTLEMPFDDFPDGDDPLILPRATPLVSVTSVKYYDEDDVEYTWSSSEYDADTYGIPGCIRPKSNYSYPTADLRDINPVIVRYVAGTETDPDEMLAIPILMLVSGIYENREAFSEAKLDTIASEHGIRGFLDKMRAEYAF